MDINTVSIKHRGKRYGAGRCWVIIGRSSFPAVACRAGKEKIITADSHAVEWLRERGLTKRFAEALVRKGIKANTK